MPTEIVIARRNGDLKTQDGQRYRLVRGRTTAHVNHPAVLAYPDVWVPLPVHLQMPEPTDGEESAEAAAARFAGQLERLAAGLAERGIELGDTSREGWLVDATLAALDQAGKAVEPVDEQPAAGDAAAERAAVRAWAAENQIEVSPHGKIPQAVVDQYRAAQNAG